MEQAKRKVHDVCIAYIKEGSKTIEEVKAAFDEYCNKNGAHARPSRESVIGWREIVAGAVVIDCLHALNDDQVYKLEKELKEIAGQWN